LKFTYCKELEQWLLITNYRSFPFRWFTTSTKRCTQIEVTFDIDANGIIKVSATDKGTISRYSYRSSSGQQKKSKMKKDAEANADADKVSRERAEKLNEGME
jgi:molecular chaperone DnaK (HSP70)